MPVRIPEKLPAIEILKEENIFVMDSTRAHNQDIRPLKIVVLNLMPIKVTTETDLIRLLSNTPLQVDLTLMKLESHTSKNTPVEHMMAFYRPFSELQYEKFDGMIITGAPVEQYNFEDVNYWNELTRIFSWARTNVYSTLYICWASQAGLYYHYGVDKRDIPMKQFGIFEHFCVEKQDPIFRGFDDTFFMPQSRHTEIVREQVEANPELQIIADSEESGMGIIKARGGREFFITGHMEYSPNTLHNEYMRDLGKRDDVGLPQHYYKDDNPQNEPIVRWRAHANLFYHNWLNYYIYQPTPFNIEDICE